jgi:hypothetical protein
MDDFSIPGASNAFGLAPFTTNYVEVRLAPLTNINTTEIGLLAMMSMMCVVNE